MAVVGAAPCQCFSPGANHTTSPGRMSSMGPPQRCARPTPDVTIRVCPSGWVCHAVRAPGSNVTLAPAARAGCDVSNRGSMRTVPVNHSAGPFVDGCEPLLLISMSPLGVVVQARPNGSVTAATAHPQNVPSRAFSFPAGLPASHRSYLCRRPGRCVRGRSLLGPLNRHSQRARPTEYVRA
jgi:hypothetical protein